ncbi:hypothetical protein B0A55_06916 [Friedmanniomyces simplex]|uniref:Uncharacterized protein n=1 Tax=Friedmanniomyces simplex TaxID=329884 RepID=A0A4U0X5S1_9PEZI|nr:hypothetical protein B0A55_06916 [Friedmanniomyces simplex]
MHIELRDVDAVKAHRAHVDYKYRSKQHILQGLDLLIAQYTLQRFPGKAGVSQPYTSATLFSGVSKMNNSRTTVSEKPRKKKTVLQHGVQPIWRTGSNRVRPKYLLRLQMSTEELEKQDGLLPYDGASAVALCSEVSMRLHPITSLDDGTVDASDSRSQADAIMSSSSPRPVSVAPGEYTPATLRKASRKRIVELDDASIGRHETEVSDLGDSLPTSEHVDAEGSTSTTSPQKNELMFWQDVAAESVQSSNSRPPPADRLTTLHETPPQHVQKPQTTPGLLHVLHTRQNNVSSSGPPHTFDLAEVAAAMQELQLLTQKTVERLFAALKLPHSQDSPFEWQAGPGLQTLYQRCWGPTWLETCSSLRSLRFVLAPDAVLSLIAAFLYDSVLSDAPLWHSFLKESIRFADHLQEILAQHQIGRLLDDLVSPHNAQQPAAHDFARNLYGEAFARLRTNTTQLGHLGDGRSEHLANSLCVVLEPHLRRLDNISKEMHPRDQEERWQEIFCSGVKNVIKQAILLKIKLAGASLSEYGHQFTWFEHGSPADGTRMHTKNEASQMDGYQVAFTLFPGVQASFPDGTTDHAAFAEVIV